jgi:hypothetical protein
VEVLSRLAYLTVTNTFAVLRLLPMSDRDRDVEILALRHQIAVLQRHLGPQTVIFTPADRASSPRCYSPCPGRSYAARSCSSDPTRYCDGTAI